MQLDKNKTEVAVSKVGHCIHVNAIYWFVRNQCNKREEDGFIEIGGVTCN